MVLFLASFLAIYGAMHALVYWGVRPLLTGHPALPSLTWAWMGLMILAPVLCRLLDHAGLALPARVTAWIGYCWMGLLFLAFSLFALLAVWEAAAWLAARLTPLPRLGLHGPQSAALVILVALAAGLYGVYEATHLRVERIRLESARLPEGMETLRIAQVSDLHLGLIHREETLAPVVSALIGLEPDLVVATGDIVDAQISHLDGLSALWRRIEPPLGKYAVTGNHEFYAGLDQALGFLEGSGFKLLRNEVREVKGLFLAGVDDPAGGTASPAAPLLETIGRERFTLLLKHRPTLEAQAVGRFDLQLSGHAHRGQIFPFNFVTALRYPLQNGLYPLPVGHLYTSRGTGSWGPPMRVLAPPEVTLFEIVRAPKAAGRPAE